MPFSAMKKIRNFGQVFIVLSGLLFLLAFAQALYAATYYVDATNELDTNNGLSDTTPWKTIAKVNAYRFSPGDQILFKRGKIWREQLTVPSSGAAGNPITLGAYGSGANPTIDGSDIVSAWTPDGSITNVYNATVVAIPTQVFNNGVRATQGASKAALTEGQWYASGTTLSYYESAGNPGSQSYTVTASTRYYGINLDGKNYVTVQDLEITKANHTNIWIDGCNNLTVQRNTISYGYNSGLRTGNGGTTASLIDSNIIHHNSGIGIQLIAAGSTNNTISNNTVYRNGLIPVVSGGYGGIYFFETGMGNVIGPHNVVYKNGYYDDDSVSPGMAGGIWLDTVASGTSILRNLSYQNNYDGYRLEDTSGCTMAYNISYGHTNSNLYGTGFNIGSANQMAPTANNLIYNNTSYSDYWSFTIVGYSNGATGKVTNNLIKNNIFYAPTGGYALYATDGAENDGTMGSGNVYSNNIFGPETNNFIRWGKRTVYNTIAAWQTAGGPNTANNLGANPLFVSTSTPDFHLQSNSPAIKAGTDVGLTRDYEGNPVITPPNIGAYDNQYFRPSAPTGLRIILGSYEIKP